MSNKFVGILEKIRLAANNDLASLTTDEKLLAALVLDRSDWLVDMRFTFAKAIEQLGTDSLKAIPMIARLVAREKELIKNRFTYRIEPLPEKQGGGFTLRLFDSGIEVDGGIFPITGKSVQYKDEIFAYSQAVNAALNWVDAHR